MEWKSEDGVQFVKIVDEEDDEFWNKKTAEGFGNLEDSDDYDHKWDFRDEAFTYNNSASNIM